MHKLLRAVGFKKIETKKEEAVLLKKMETCPPWGGPDCLSHQHKYEELKCTVGEDFGVILHGWRNDEGSFQREYYFPYMYGQQLLQTKDNYIRRHNSTESYEVLCDDVKSGTSLIFYLINGIEYQEQEECGAGPNIKGVYLTGMAEEGSILLPIRKSSREIAEIEARTQTRDMMMQAARGGNDYAWDILALDEINTYGQLNRRLKSEDVYSIVDSTFMPSGMECDCYTVLGEILRYEILENQWSQEKIWRMQVECNGIEITVCINSADLLGEPKVGRRFKGEIWLQGYGVFEK